MQAIKRPTLLEITGPLFMSVPVVSNMQYRLTEVDGGTLDRRSGTRRWGSCPTTTGEGLWRGWTPLLERVRQQAEGCEGLTEVAAADTTRRRLRHVE